MTSRPKQRTKHNNRETCVCESSQTLTSDFGFDFDVRLCVWHQISVWKYLIQKLCTAKRGTVFRSVILVGWLVILVTIPWTSYFKYNNYFCRTVYNYITVATSFFTTIIMIINPFSTGNIEKLDFWDTNNSTNFNHKCKVYQPAYHKKAYRRFFKERSCKGNLYFYRFRDITFQKYVDIITRSVGYRERKG